MPRRSDPRITIGRAVSALLATVRTLATKRATMEEDDRMLFRQHERWVEELSVQLQLDKPITASGSVLTLPAATLDLQDGWAISASFCRCSTTTGNR